MLFLCYYTDCSEKIFNNCSSDQSGFRRQIHVSREAATQTETMKPKPEEETALRSYPSGTLRSQA